MFSLTTFPWRSFFKRLYEKAFDTDIFNRSAQVAFYFSFAIFPLLIFLISLFGLILDSTEGLKNELFAYLREVLPGTASDLVRNTVEEIVQTSSGGKLTLGLFFTLWSASAGIDSIRRGLNAVYELKETRSWWRTKALAIVITLVVLVLTAIVLGIVFYGWQIARVGLATAGIEITSPLILASVQWISILLVLLFACEVIFNLIPNVKRFRWRWVTPGSIVAIVLWIIFTSGFRLYLQYFNSYNKTYGSLGAVIILLLWLYLTALAVMIGGAINAIIHELHLSNSADK